MEIKELFRNVEFPIELFDSNGKRVYYEGSVGEWSKCEYDSKGNKVYYADCNGKWSKWEYDSTGNEIYYETTNGYCRYWSKREYDSNGNPIYYKNSDGNIRDNRPNQVVINGTKYSEDTVQLALEQYVKGEKHV